MSKHINLLGKSPRAHASEVLDGIMVNTIADLSVKCRHLNTKIKFDESAVEKTELEEQQTEREPLRDVPKEAKGSNIASNEPSEKDGT